MSSSEITIVHLTYMHRVGLRFVGKLVQLMEILYCTEKDAAVAQPVKNQPCNRRMGKAVIASGHDVRKTNDRPV